MKHSLLLSLLLAAATALPAQTLKESIGRHFLIGAAVNTRQVNGDEPKAVNILQQQFNAVVAENCMKPENIEPHEGQFHWDDADKFVKFALDNHLTPTGHVLVWHSQTAPWMFVNQHGELPNREQMIQRMHDYIFAVVGRYKGRILGWDVVNEAFNDDGTLRPSPWARAIGPDFIQLAFRFAHEADPNAELYYNDYSMDKPGKRKAVVALIRQLRDAGLRIDAIGMQSHNGMNYPDIHEYEQTIQAIIATGVKVQFTELDFNVLPMPWNVQGADVNQRGENSSKMNPYPNKLPADVQKQQADRIMDFFRLYKKYESHIRRVTLWGVTDGDSWLNGWPIPGRTNYPLLFDRKMKPKPVVKDIVRMFESPTTAR